MCKCQDDRINVRETPTGRAEVYRGVLGSWNWNCAIGGDYYCYCSFGKAKTFEQAYAQLNQHLKEKHA